MKLRTGDHVVVISGKDKGKSGTILRVLHETNRVVVSDVNMRKKHIKKQADRAGQIIRYEASLSASNVAFLDPKLKKPTRIGFTFDENGRKQRIAKLSAQTIVEGKKTKVVREGKEEKEGKEGKEAVEQRGEAPKKAPFWKKMAFGAEAVKDAADVTEGSRMTQDHSVPAQDRSQSTLQHSRGQ
ncbi:MAG: 50S ribosomal protein L24 [Candidatus Peregrinibacteria bacterium]